MSSIRLLSSNLIAKHYEPDMLKDTIKAVELAHQLGVRDPYIKRIVHHNHNAASWSAFKEPL